MTVKKDLKRRVRERQAKTGESYMAARRKVVAEAPVAAEAAPGKGAIPVEEMLDVTADAESLGFACRVTLSEALDARIDRLGMLVRLRDALLATADDPALARLRAVALRGEPVDLPRRMPAGWFEAMKRFMARAIAGIGGVSDEGHMLAFAIDGRAGSVMVIAHVGFRHVPAPAPAPRPPRLVITAVDALIAPPEGLAMMFVP